MPFKSQRMSKNQRGLNFTLHSYCALLNNSIELLDNNDENTKPMENNNKIELIEMRKPQWAQIIKNFEDAFSFAAGDTASMQQFKEHTNRKRMAKQKSAASCFDPF